MVLKEKSVGNFETLQGNDTLRHVYQSSPHSSEGVLKMEVRPPKDWLVM